MQKVLLYLEEEIHYVMFQKWSMAVSQQMEVI